jgi:hypothetical protein
MNWNTNVISTSVSGSMTPLASDLAGAGGKTITLAFATGECGSENWGGVEGGAMATANVQLLTQAGIRYVISTGGAAGSFTCGSDAGFATFVGRWASSGLVGVDFDIEAGQSTSVIGDLVSRIATAHTSYPALRFSLTLATLANNDGASTAQSLGSGVQDSFNTYGDQVMAAVQSTLGFSGSAATWPSYLTVDLMTMDYGSPSAGVCVVSGGSCDMGQSAIQAAYNLHDRWGVPYSNIELTPMIGGNDVSSEQFKLADADAIASFALAQGLAGIHYWSYDRDVDCPAGSASPTCNSMGSGYAGPRGYLGRFLADGLCGAGVGVLVARRRSCTALQLRGRAESIRASRSGALACTVADGPVNLKNHEPLGASTISPTSRHPGWEGAWGAAGMRIPE